MSYIPNRDFLIEVAKGKVLGHSIVNKFGEHGSIPADTIGDIWDGEGDYVFPTSATITHIRAAVNSAATQGLVVEVQGLDANWDLVVQEQTLGATSTTEVALTTPLLRVFRIKVLADIVADEDIWIGATGMSAATAKAIVLAGNNQTLMAIYTVPAGYTAYMMKYYCSVTLSLNKEPTGLNCRLWVADRSGPYEFQLKHSIGIQNGAGALEHTFITPFKITEKSDIKITGLPYAEAGQVSAGFDLLLVKNV